MPPRRLEGSTWDQARETVNYRLNQADAVSREQDKRLDENEKRLSSVETAIAVRDARSATVATFFGALAGILGSLIVAWISSRMKP